ncbi:MAG: ABC transporter ATP-binding protein [Planctomycetes bacterium HGW-Planctomycetes-1]|nr:MAG: ABC transporter ATP-binding protein [Planctomycetes bacterium HGW-Planctomycetes-1]
MSQTVIEIEDLSFSISGKRILEQIRFCASAGQRLFIVGPNGAGKTTLLRCLSRIISDWQGSIKVKGKNIRAYPQKKLAKILTYVPQVLPADIPFTTHQFILMARYPHLSPFSVISPQDEKIVSDAMDMTQTACFAERVMATLSGGERQQVSITAAVAQQAEIFLLDEPATYLDYKHQRDIHSLLAKINKTCGTTIVCVTHDLNSAVLSADKIIALKEGKIVFEGTSQEIMNEDTLEKIYSKKFDFAQHPVTGQKIIVPDVIE